MPKVKSIWVKGVIVSQRSNCQINRRYFFRDVLQEMSSVITPFRGFQNKMKIGFFDHCFIAKITTSSIRLFLMTFENTNNQFFLDVLTSSHKVFFLICSLFVVSLLMSSSAFIYFNRRYLMKSMPFKKQKCNNVGCTFDSNTKLKWTLASGCISQYAKGWSCRQQKKEFEREQRHKNEMA